MNNRELLIIDYYRFLDQFGQERPKISGSVNEVLHKINQAGDEVAKKELFDLIKKLDNNGFDISQFSFEDPYGYNGFLNDIKNSETVPENILNSLFCAEFPTNDFNASARKTNNGFLCLLNRGLRHYLYRISCAVSYGCSDYNNLETALIEKDNPKWLGMAIYGMGTCANYLFNKNINFNWGGRDQSPDCLFLGSAFSSSMRTFVVAHEVAHVKLGHLENNRNYHLTTPQGEVEIIYKSYEQEYEADLFAQYILFNMARRERAVGNLCGGVCFFYSEIILKIFREKIISIPDNNSKTHPSSEYRIDLLFKYITEHGTNYEIEFVNKAIRVFQQLEQIVASSEVELKDGEIHFKIN